MNIKTTKHDRFFALFVLHFFVFSCYLPDLKSQESDETMPEVRAKIEEKATMTAFSSTLLQMQEPATLTANPLEQLAIFSRTKNSKSSWQKKPYLMDANARITFQLLPFHWKNIYGNFHFEPRIMIRMFQDDSLKGDVSHSIRTPSYIPSGTINLTTKRWYNHHSGKYISLRFFHHSDGQDGPLFKENGWFNTFNGDFGDVFAQDFCIGLFKKKNGEGITATIDELKARKRNQKVVASNTLFWGKAGYEVHWKKWQRKDLTDYHLFGLHRAIAVLGWRKSEVRQKLDIPAGTSGQQLGIKTEEVEQFKAVLNLHFILDREYNTGPMGNLRAIKPLDMSKRLNVSAAFYYHPPYFKHVGLFIQGGYFGSDEYNVYFQHSIWFYKFGLSAGIF